MQTLQNRWRCLECSSNGYCFRKRNPETGKEEHFNLEPRLLSLWAAQMASGEAVATYPPCQIEEFNNLLHPKSKNRSKSTRSTTLTPQISESNTSGPPINVVCNFPERMQSPTTPPIRNAVPQTFTSPVYGVAPAEYNGQGLLEFMEFCKDRYEDDSFTEETLEKLLTQNIGVDVIKDGIDAVQLQDICKIKFGTAVRILQSFSNWEAKKRKVYLQGDPTYPKLISSNCRSNLAFDSILQYICKFVKIFSATELM
jgi:hypothetical protein